MFAVKERALALALGVGLAAGLGLGVCWERRRAHRSSATALVTSGLGAHDPIASPADGSSSSVPAPAPSLAPGSGAASAEVAAATTAYFPECAEHPSTFMYVFFDLETTGLDSLTEGITQLAAYIDELPEPPFVSYVKATRPIPKKVTEITGITAATLAGAPSLRDVIWAFVGWLACATAAVRARRGKVTPVLVAHNGAMFDFPFVLAEMDRAGVALGVFDAFGVHFVDSIAVLRQVKASPDVFPAEAARLTELGSVALPKLYPFLFGSQFAAHNALADVQALARVMLHSSIASAPVLELLASHVTPAKAVIESFARRARARAVYNSARWPQSDKPVLSKPLADSMVDLGLSVQALHDAAAATDGTPAQIVASLNALGLHGPLDDLARYLSGAPI